MADEQGERGRAQQPRTGRNRQVRRSKERAKLAQTLVRPGGQAQAAQPPAEGQQVRAAKPRQMRAKRQPRAITMSTQADSLAVPVIKVQPAQLSQLRQAANVRSTLRLGVTTDPTQARLARLPIGKVDKVRTAQLKRQATTKVQSRLRQRPQST